ncbi:MAG: hypothetical protein R3E79_26540 [Caldilineaceae bacterium]
MVSTSSTNEPTNPSTISLSNTMIDEARLILCSADCTAPLVCGAMTTCTLQLEVRTALARQARLRFHFTQSPYYDQPPDYGLSAKGFVFYHRVHFQTGNPQGIGYLTATAASGQPVQMELEKGRCFFTLLCPDGMQAGDRLTVVIGDRSAGGPGIEVVHHPTYGDWRLRCTVDRLGNGHFVEQVDTPVLRVVTAAPHELLVHLPAQTWLNQASDLQITVVGRYGNHVRGYNGQFQVTVAGQEHVTTTFAITPTDGGSKRFPGALSLQNRCSPHPRHHHKRRGAKTNRRQQPHRLPAGHKIKRCRSN